MMLNLTLRVCETVGSFATLVVTSDVICNVVESELTWAIECYYNSKVIGVGFVVRRMNRALGNMS